MFWETDSTPINQNINTIPQKKPEKVESTCKEPLTPQRTSTYERPFIREGNYLVNLFDAEGPNQVQIELDSYFSYIRIA